MHPIPYPLKTSENRKVFWCFQGLQKGYTGYERINKYWNSTENHTLSLLFQIYINFEIRSGEKPKLKSHDRAYPSCFMHAIVARMRLPFFKIFSNFVHFCSNFQIFYPFFAFFFFFPFFWKIAHMPLLSRIGPARLIDIYINSNSWTNFPWKLYLVQKHKTFEEVDLKICKKQEQKTFWEYFLVSQKWQY